MVSISTKENQFALLLSQEEFNLLGLDPGKEYELHKAKPGIWVLTEKAAAEKKPAAELKESALDAKIFWLIKSKPLTARVEGKFEKLLNREEAKRLQHMVQEGKVVKFKLSPKYKKAVYKIAEAEKKESEDPDAAKKDIEQYEMQRDGFMVCLNEERAKRISEEMRKQIEEGSIKGIKSFEGYFYIIENGLYNKYREKVLRVIKEEKNVSLQKLKELAGISQTLAKIACEFLKDEGEIIEKRKEQYCYVE